MDEFGNRSSIDFRQEMTTNFLFSIFYFLYLLFDICHLPRVLFIGLPPKIANDKYQIENRKSLVCVFP